MPRKNRRLIPLSWEHHHGLLLVWRIRRGLERATAPEVLRRYLIRFWDQYIQPHFETEETTLLPLLPPLVSNEENDVDRLRQDHREIRDLVDALRRETAPEPCLAYTRTFADKLERHIRFEERDIFPLAERTIPPDSLDVLDRRLHAQFRRVVEDVEGPDFWT